MTCLELIRNKLTKFVELSWTSGLGDQIFHFVSTACIQVFFLLRNTEQTQVSSSATHTRNEALACLVLYPVVNIIW